LQVSQNAIIQFGRQLIWLAESVSQAGEVDVPFPLSLDRVVPYDPLNQLIFELVVKPAPRSAVKNFQIIS